MLRGFSDTVCSTPTALVTVHVSAHLLYGCLSRALTQTRYRNMMLTDGTEIQSQGKLVNSFKRNWIFLG